MIQDVLTLTTVQVAKEVETPDGMGGFSTTTTLTTLGHSMIWQNGSSNRWLSERLARDSSHTLAFLPAEYTFDQDDRKVIKGNETYTIVGRPDDIMQKNELGVVPLNRIT